MERTGFGRYVRELRLARSVSQTDFAKLTGWSLSRVSNLEHQRSNISDDVVGVYIAVLNCTGAEAHELRKRAAFSNNMRDVGSVEEKTSPLQALLKQFGPNISDNGRARLQKVLEEETGESVASLAFSSNRTSDISPQLQRKRTTQRPSLVPKRLAQICLMAEQVRQTVAGEMGVIDVGLLLDQLAISEDRFDYEVRLDLPSYAEGAFACITGHSVGHTLLIEESRFFATAQGQHFARHVIAHEIGHHFLHGDLLVSNGTLFLPPQELAKNRMDANVSGQRIEQLVDNIVEVEAECFATFLIVPWTAFLKGTTPEYLSGDYKEQLSEVKRYYNHFKNEAVLNEFRHLLWNAGRRDHAIFNAGLS